MRRSALLVAAAAGLAALTLGGRAAVHLAAAPRPGVGPMTPEADVRSSTPAPSPPPPAPSSDAAGSTRVALPHPVNHCAHNRHRQLVLVSISAQHAWMCARTRTVYSTAVTTGRAGKDTATPTGRFHVQGRDRNTVLHPDGGGSYPVRYWIPFDAPDYGFHDASWQHFPFGGAKYKIAGSHGCVHLPLKAVRFLYNWADVGATVLIRA